MRARVTPTRARVLLVVIAIVVGLLIYYGGRNDPTIPRPSAPPTTALRPLPVVPRPSGPVGPDAYDDVPLEANNVARVTWRTTSTMYCLKGGTRGGVAVSPTNFRRLHHSRWRVIAEDRPHWAKRSPLVRGRTFTVADKGPRAHFDMWTPDCRLAREYGARTITVERVA